jgi:hypothetical protein
MHDSVHGRINTMPDLPNDNGADCAPADRRSAQNPVLQMPTVRQDRTNRRGLRYGNSNAAPHKRRQLITSSTHGPSFEIQRHDERREIVTWIFADRTINTCGGGSTKSICATIVPVKWNPQVHRLSRHDVASRTRRENLKQRKRRRNSVAVKHRS